jgi:hypothetical protein
MLEMFAPIPVPMQGTMACMDPTKKLLIAIVQTAEHKRDDKGLEFGSCYRAVADAAG